MKREVFDNSDSDAKLCGLAAQNNEDAAEAMISRYMPLARSRARFFADSYSESYEDLCQEAFIGLLAAIRSFDDSKSAFPTFARLCIDRMLFATGRLQNRKKQIPKSQILVSGEDFESDLVFRDTAENPEDVIIRKENLERLGREIEGKLTELEYAVLLDYVSGNSYEAIALKRGISVKSVDNALQRIRRKLR